MSEALLFDEIRAAIRLQQRMEELHERAANEADAMAQENEMAEQERESSASDNDSAENSSDDET
jgi:hypothetical protein